MVLFVLFLIATFGGAFIGFIATCALTASRLDYENDLLIDMANALEEADDRIEAARNVLAPGDNWLFYTRREQRAYAILAGNEPPPPNWSHQAEGEQSP